MKEFKIRNPVFLEVCDIAERCSVEALEGFLEKMGTVEIEETVSLTSNIQIEITPAFFLAYQNKHEAVNFLIVNVDKQYFALKKSSLKGYALIGYIMPADYAVDDGIGTERKIDAKIFFDIGKYLAFGRQEQAIFNMVLFPPSDPYSDFSLSRENRIHNEILQGFISGLRQILPITHPKYLSQWLINYIDFKDCIFMEKFLTKLKADKVVSYNPFGLLSASQKIYSVTRSVQVREKIIVWAGLYPWLLHRTKTIQKLPLAMVTHIVSFLSPEHALFLTTQMPCKMERILFSSLVNKNLFLDLAKLIEKEDEKYEADKAKISGAEEYSFSLT